MEIRILPDVDDDELDCACEYHKCQGCDGLPTGHRIGEVVVAQVGVIPSPRHHVEQVHKLR